MTDRQATPAFRHSPERELIPAAMLRAMAQHRIVPVVDKVFAFAELKEAMAYLKSGAQFGKVCIQH